MSGGPSGALVDLPSQHQRGPRGDGLRARDQSVDRQYLVVAERCGHSPVSYSFHVGIKHELRLQPVRLFTRCVDFHVLGLTTADATPPEATTKPSAADANACLIVSSLRLIRNSAVPLDTGTRLGCSGQAEPAATVSVATSQTPRRPSRRGSIIIRRKPEAVSKSVAKHWRLRLIVADGY